MEIAVADFPLFGMRTRMIVSVFVDSSSPARSVASSSSDSGLPCASVRLSRPTSRMSIAPSSPPPPSAAEVMWLMPDSKERILLHATPVPMTIVAASTTARVRTRRGGISPGYLRQGCIGGSRRSACQTRLVANRIVITGANGQVGRFLTAEVGRRNLDALALSSAEWDITEADAAERIVESGDVVINCAAFTAVDAAESEPDRAHAVNARGPG